MHWLGILVSILVGIKCDVKVGNIDIVSNSTSRFFTFATNVKRIDINNAKEYSTRSAIELLYE